MTAFRGATLMLMTGCLWIMLALIAVDRPQPPTVVRAPSILSELDEVWVDVRSEPHPDRRSVILEAWEAEPVEADDPEMPTLYEPRRLVRSSLEPVTEGNARQLTFPFRWRQSFKPGIYLLVARVVVGRGLSYASRPHRLQVV